MARINLKKQDKQDKLRCLFIGLFKNEAHLNEVKVICKPKIREWTLLILI